MKINEKNRIGITAMSYELPSTRFSLPELRKTRVITSKVETLSDFGFRYAYIAECDAFDLALRATRKLFKTHKVDPDSIDVIIYATALSDTSKAKKKTIDPIMLFRYPATHLQYEMGMRKAQVMGISQAGCVSLWTAIRVAKSMLISDTKINKVLCVSADVLPKGSVREILYNVVSDAACAVLIERNAFDNVIVSETQITKGFYWSPADQKNEVVASYFPTAKRVIADSLAYAKMTIDDIRYIVPHNVNRQSWEVLASMAGIPIEKVYLKNIPEYGHTVASDNIINLLSLSERGLIKKGDNLLLFTYGFGSHWSSTIIRH